MFGKKSIGRKIKIRDMNFRMISRAVVIITPGLLFFKDGTDTQFSLFEALKH